MISIVCCEIHSKSNRKTLNWFERFPGISTVTWNAHVQFVETGIGSKLEGLVLSGIPFPSVVCLDFHSKDPSSGFRELVNFFIPIPESSTQVTEPSSVFRPRTIEICHSQTESLVDDYPVVYRKRRLLNSRDDKGQISVKCHEIWRNNKNHAVMTMVLSMIVMCETIFE